MIAAVPLFIALLALRFDPDERATGRRLVGLFIGLAGVVALVGHRRRRRAPTSCSAPALILVAALRLRGRADGAQAPRSPTSTRARRWARAC